MVTIAAGWFTRVLGCLMNTLKLLPGATPFYLCGNDIGCVLVHGLTGTPYSMRWLGEYLNQQGYSVCAPRLAGHGTHPEDLIGIRWREWYVDVLSAYCYLRESCRKVFVVGLSMGGALALLFAADNDVDGVVAMSAPHHIDHPLLPYLPILRHLTPLLPKRHLPPPEQNVYQQYVQEEQRRRGLEPVGEIGYDVWATAAIIEINRMLRAMQAGLPRIVAPSLLMHSRVDRTVPFQHLALNYDRVGSADKQMLVLERSEHIITNHVEHDVVWQATAAFMAAHT